MPKKILVLISLSLIFMSQAMAKDLCHSFRVRIKNFSAYDCTLKTSHIFNGVLSNDTEVPKVIFKGFSEDFDMKSSTRYVGNVLTYQCGDNNEITLFSINFTYRYPKYGILVDADVVNKQHLLATSKYKKEDCNDWGSSTNYNTVEWTIKDEFTSSAATL